MFTAAGCPRSSREETESLGAPERARNLGDGPSRAVSLGSEEGVGRQDPVMPVPLVEKERLERGRRFTFPPRNRQEASPHMVWGEGQEWNAADRESPFSQCVGLEVVPRLLQPHTQPQVGSGKDTPLCGVRISSVCLVWVPVSRGHK